VVADEDPRAAFVRREHPRLVGALSLYCGDLDVAEEVAQEALARACRDWSRLAGMRSPGAWTHRVAINLANSWYRRRSAEQRARARHGPSDDGVGREADSADVLAVRQAVAALPRRQRAAVVLRYFSDLPVTEVADALGCAEGTVKALTHKGIANLRRQLDDPGLQPDPEEARDAR
jgi:RNA polymerase sigma-70 factor (sigma-E family)